MALSAIWRNFITFKSTIIMIKKGCLFVLLALCVSVGFAQKSDSVAQKKNKSIYLELLGASTTIGVSYDSRVKSGSNWGYRVGVAYYQSLESLFSDGALNKGVFFPVGVNYLIGKKKHKFELGLGVSPGFYKWEEVYMWDIPSGDVEIRSFSQKRFAYYFFSDIGYRYQSAGGFLFRVGLNPSFSFKGQHAIDRSPDIFPYFGFGYSF